MSAIWNKIVSLASQVTGTLSVVNGGTGVTTSTGTGNTVLSASPTLVTPLLGTPASGNLVNATGYTTANLTTNTGSSAPSASAIGETIYGPSNKSTGALLTLTSATTKNLQTLTLSSGGVWLITAQVQYEQGDNSTSTSTTFDFTVSKISNSNMTGCSGNNACIDYQSIDDISLTLGGQYISSGVIAFTYVTSAADQLWLNCQVTFTGSAPKARGGFMVVRIA